MIKISIIVFIFFLLLKNLLFSKNIKFECELGDDYFKKNVLIIFDIKKKIVMYGERPYDLHILDDYYVGIYDATSEAKAIIFADNNLDKKAKKEMLEHEYFSRISLDRYTGKLLWGMYLNRENIFKNINRDIEIACTHKDKKKF